RRATFDRGGCLILTWFIGLTFSLMLLLYLLKGLFRRSAPRPMLLEVQRSEQPELFEFIDRLCDDTRAPRPRGVYLSHEVNACVFYRQSLLNLIFPRRKDLH